MSLSRTLIVPPLLALVAGGLAAEEGGEVPIEEEPQGWTHKARIGGFFTSESSISNYAQEQLGDVVVIGEHLIDATEQQITHRRIEEMGVDVHRLVVQREEALQVLGHGKADPVAGEDEGFFAESTDLDAAAAATLAGIFQ